MERNFRPGDKVQIKSDNECILGTVIEATEEAVTVQLEEVSHTVVIEKYRLDTLQLCDDK